MQYLQILGFTPAASRLEATDFYTPFGTDTAAILTVHHDSNTFSDSVNHRQGHLVDLISQLYGATPKEIMQDIMPYRLDILMQQTEPEQTARPWAVFSSSSFKTTTMSQPIIIIEIQNGKLDAVYSNADIRFILIDRDNAGTGQPTVTGPFSPTLVKADLGKACPDDPGVLAALLAPPAATLYF